MARDRQNSRVSYDAPIFYALDPDGLGPPKYPTADGSEPESTGWNSYPGARNLLTPLRIRAPKLGLEPEPR